MLQAFLAAALLLPASAAFAGGGTVTEMTCEYAGAGTRFEKPCTRYMDVHGTSTTFEFNGGTILVEGDYYDARELRIDGAPFRRDEELLKCFYRASTSENFCFIGDDDWETSLPQGEE